MYLIPLKSRVTDNMRPALLILWVEPINPGPVTVMTAGVFPGGNWILPAGLDVTVFCIFWIES